jgi:dCMP deaminase
MNTTRLSREAWAMEVARVTARRATCLRRAVGCVLLDADGFILSTGYNGVAAGQPHCNKQTDTARDWDQANRVERTAPVFGHACPGAFAASGTNLDGCHAIHAEQNALLRCPDVRRIHSAYVTASPCMTCVKLLMNTSCQIIVFDEPYPHNAAADLWRSMGRLWIDFKETYPS